tara:strand:+ start:5554 stop:6198 length:645 start_codon:yes stop_codon:yes gene_type:complete
MKALLHNLGLGDHILCNGLVRELCKREESLSLFVLEKNAKNVAFMFSDLDNLNLIEVDNGIHSFDDIGINDIGDFEIINVSGNTHGNGFERKFYERAKVDFEKKWESFHVPRCIDKEKKLFDSLGLVEGEYSFVHEWNKLSIPDNPPLRNVRPFMELGDFFDFGYLIENAAEIHCMESSFKNLIEFLDLKTSFLRFYKGREGSKSLSRLNWEEV